MYGYDLDFSKTLNCDVNILYRKVFRFISLLIGSYAWPLSDLGPLSRAVVGALELTSIGATSNTYGDSIARALLFVRGFLLLLELAQYASKYS